MPPFAESLLVHSGYVVLDVGIPCCAADLNFRYVGFYDVQASEEVHKDVPCEVRTHSIPKLYSLTSLFSPSSPRVTGLSKDTIFGLPIPSNLSTCIVSFYS
jgi:hypothetical protein